MGLSRHLARLLADDRSTGPFVTVLSQTLLLFSFPSCFSILGKRSRERKRGMIGFLSFFNLKFVGNCQILIQIM